MAELVHVLRPLTTLLLLVDYMVNSYTLVMIETKIHYIHTMYRVVNFYHHDDLFMVSTS